MILSFGSVLIGILSFIFALALIILIHEGGHFFFARRANILCREYAFGMGPQLVKFKKGETTYALNLFPIGGYCAIAGETEEDDPLKELKEVRLVIEDGIIKKFIIDDKNHLFDDYPMYEIVKYDIFDEQDTGNLYMVVKENEEEVEYKVDPQAMYVFTKPYNGEIDKENLEKKRNKYSKEFQIAPHNRTLNAKSKGARALVMFGGPLMNFILAIVVFFFAGLMNGYSDTSKTKLIVSEGTIAYVAGLRDGDTITALETPSLGKKETKEWNDISSFMSEYKKDTSTFEKITIYYNSDNVEKTTSIYPQTVIYSISLLQDINDQTNVRVGTLNTSSPAYVGGLREGDIIKAISYKDDENKMTVKTWKDVYKIFLENEKGKEMTIYALRGDEQVEAVVDPYSRNLFKRTQNVDTAVIILGISPSVKHGFFHSIGYSFTELFNSIKKMIFTLGYLLFSSEVGIKDLSGPVGIYTMTSQAAQGGFANLLYWIGFLSVNVGFLNLLPIPALDGGRLLFVGIEAVTKKKVSEKVETILINITMLLLFGLIIFASYNDILRAIGVK